MSNPQADRANIKKLFIVMLIGAALIAVIATVLPSYVDLDDQTAMMMRIMFYAAAALGVGQAFWLRAKLTKQLPPEERTSAEPKRGGTVERQ